METSSLSREAYERLSPPIVSGGQFVSLEESGLIALAMRRRSLDIAVQAVGVCSTPWVLVCDRVVMPNLAKLATGASFEKMDTF